MPIKGVTIQTLKRQLNEWLYLSLDASVPSSLLILSRAFTYVVLGRVVTTEDALHQTLSSLPEVAVEVYSNRINNKKIWALKKV